MAITINISGKDYSYYKKEHVELIDDNNVFPQDDLPKVKECISSIFLDRIAREVINYKNLVEYDKADGNFNRENDFLLCEKEESKDKVAYKFNNIVGVMINKDITVTEEDLERYMLTESINESEAENKRYLDEDLRELIKNEKYNIKLQVGSRFDNERSYFLLTMLLQNIPEIDEVESLMKEDDVYNFLLVYMYRKQLLESYIQGPYRTYTYFEENDSNLKGVIDIASHIKLNMGLDNGKMAYKYRENTADNHINHLFLHTYEHIKRFYPDLTTTILMEDMEVSKIINELYTICNHFEYSNISTTMNKSRKMIAHPFYHEYDKLRLTSMMLLQHLGISMFDGDGEEVQGVLFYVPDLWEMYLERILTSKFTIEAQAERRIFGNLGGEEFKKKTYPDYIFIDESNDDLNNQIIILDAKYRIGWGREFIRKGYDRDDYTKCIRDMNTINASGTGVIFPMNEMNIKNESQSYRDLDLDTIAYQDEYIKHKISEYNKYDNFYSFPIIIPETAMNISYPKWSQKFKENIEKSLSKINEAYEYERTRKKKIVNIQELDIDQLSFTKENFEILKKQIKDVKCFI